MVKEELMHSMEIMQSWVLTAESAARSLEVVKLPLSEEPTEKEEENAALLKEKNEKEAKSIGKETKRAFDLIQKSLKAFFKANDGEKYSVLKFDETADYFCKKNPASGTEFYLRINLLNACGHLRLEMAKHTALSVHHNNGSTWNKNDTDKKRFTNLNECIEKISFLSTDEMKTEEV